MRLCCVRRLCSFSVQAAQPAAPSGPSGDEQGAQAPKTPLPPAQASQPAGPAPDTGIVRRPSSQGGSNRGTPKAGDRATPFKVHAWLFRGSQRFPSSIVLLQASHPVHELTSLHHNWFLGWLEVSHKMWHFVTQSTTPDSKLTWRHVQPLLNQRL